jgi:DNA-directed RNA polymerase specialized sigma24 family protein
LSSGKQLNNLVLDYRSNRSEEIFRQIYETVSASWKGLDTIGKSVKACKSEILAAYEDTLLKSIDVWEATGDFENFLKGNIKRKRCDIYRKKKRLSDFEVYYTPAESEDGSEVAFEIADEFNIEEYVIQKKKADQLALIDSLLNGADAKTTAIVEAFLTSEKSSPTAIGEALGLHHSTVLRSIKRLAGKFDSKKFGEYQDFLLAL